MIKLTLRLSPDKGESALFNEIANALDTDKFSFEIRKKSLDARHGKAFFVYTVDITPDNASDEQMLIAKCGGEYVPPEEGYIFPTVGKIPDKRPVLAGFGPAGIFCALMLARSGLRPIVIERGKAVEKRVNDVNAFFGGKGLNTESNIQYGEGGAGAFSDGKLNTLVKDKSFRGSFVLKCLVDAGAPKHTLYDAKPHIGTDLLRGIIANIRGEIIALGGEVRFCERLTGIETDGEKLTAVITDKECIDTDTLFLGTGQSAEEVLHILRNCGADLEQKPFSVGFRIEHRQRDIDASQYGTLDRNRFLPPAEYKLFNHCKTERTVYSFCMCPGGHVIAAASDEGRLVTNGMSNHARSGENANSAILCEILPSDLVCGDIFAGFRFREELERRAFALGGGDFRAPASTLGSYFGVESVKSNIVPTYPLGVKMCDISTLFSQEINASFREALHIFGKKIKGFDSPAAILTAVESRTSSPVRLVRYVDRQSNIKGIYPMGEGAGYAGGIISAAIDGIRSAEEYCLTLGI